MTVSESQLNGNVDVATGAVDGEAADVIDETSGFADEPADADDAAADTDAESVESIEAEAADAEAADAEASDDEEATPRRPTPSGEPTRRRGADRG